jgi:hypothetical protein
LAETGGTAREGGLDAGQLGVGNAGVAGETARERKRDARQGGGLAGCCWGQSYRQALIGDSGLCTGRTIGEERGQMGKSTQDPLDYAGQQIGGAIAFLIWVWLYTILGC